MSVSQNLILEEAKKLGSFNDHVTKTLAKEQDLPQYKIFDLKYYEDELDLFEKFYQGEIDIGNLKMTRSFIKSQDRLNKNKGTPESFTYMTRVIDTTREPVATIALVHGFAENISSSFLEMAFHHALNGFEVVMVDLKGFGHSSGSRCCSWTVYDWHE